MMELTELTIYLDELLDIRSIPGDKSNNGLQIEGNSEVRRIIGGVDACLELYQKAMEARADFLFVHHGESWGDGLKYFTGVCARRFRFVFENDLSLYAAHLPLDAHQDLGHNALIAAKLGILKPIPFARYAGSDIGLYGDLPDPVTIEELSSRVNQTLETDSVIYDFFGHPVTRVGVISGAGANAIHECHALGIDCLITGESDHTHYHQIKELNMVVIAAGHYKTEVPGIVAVLDHLEQRFEVDCRFIDIPTGL